MVRVGLLRARSPQRLPAVPIPNRARLCPRFARACLVLSHSNMKRTDAELLRRNTRWREWSCDVNAVDREELRGLRGDVYRLNGAEGRIAYWHGGGQTDTSTADVFGLDPKTVNIKLTMS
jgi:hypothetical protein